MSHFPFARRGDRAGEYVAAMRVLWHEEVALFDGEFVGFNGVRVNPKPVRDGGIPVVVGGNSDAALGQVAAWGDGWYGFNLTDVGTVAERIARLRELCRGAGRDLGELRLAVALRRPTVKDVAVLSELGVDELVLVDAPPASPGPAADWVAGLADRWMPALDTQ